MVPRANSRTGLATAPPYAGLRLDRATGLRGDDAWVAAAAADPRARVRPLWRDQCLVAGDPAVPIVLALGSIDGAAPAELVLLGVDDNGPQFAIDLSELLLPVR